MNFRRSAMSSEDVFHLFDIAVTTRLRLRIHLLA